MFLTYDAILKRIHTQEDLEQELAKSRARLIESKKSGKQELYAKTLQVNLALRSNVVRILEELESGTWKQV